MGVFGYLTKSHIEGAENLDANTEQLSLLDSQILIERENISAQKQNLQQLDIAVNTLSQTQRTTERAITIRNTQRRERSSIAQSISESNTKILSLQQQKLQVNKTQRSLETEIGPIKYIAQLIYGQDDSQTIEKSVRLLTILLIIVFDPLAILMVVAANIQLQELKSGKSKSPNTPIVIPPTQNVGKTLGEQNVTTMDTEWNPGSWFKIVKDGKSGKTTSL